MSNRERIKTINNKEVLNQLLDKALEAREKTSNIDIKALAGAVIFLLDLELQAAEVQDE